MAPNGDENGSGDNDMVDRMDTERTLEIRLMVASRLGRAVPSRENRAIRLRETGALRR
jgi:hypothetical protein